MVNQSYETLIKEIKGRLSISSLIENYVSLKRSGKGFVGLCPFHDDKNPSFHINEDKGIYHCFGCGAGGDIIGFLMRYKNVSFYEAIEELARRAEVKIEKKYNRSSTKSRNEILYRINSLAAEFYHKNLYAGTPSRASMEYLVKRGLSRDIIDEFCLGYAPDGWDNLVRFFTNKGISLELAESIGLVISRKTKEGSYDRFRSRIVFPISDTEGRVIGFGARILDNIGNEPKYINSPESEIYHKRSIFYGLDKASSHIRRNDKAIIVEGYFDLISLWSAGIKNVVATLGTSLTQEHASLLKRYTERVVVVFDGDKSGLNASLRVLELFLERGISTLMVVLPEGNDPDTFIQSEGGETFLKLVENATSLLDYFIRSVQTDFKEGSIGLSSAIRKVANLISWIRDPIERAHQIRRVAEGFGIRENEFYSLVKIEKQNHSENKMEIDKKFLSHEKVLLKIILKYPDLSSFLGHNDLVDFIEDETIRTIIKEIVEGEINDLSTILLRFNDFTIQKIISEAIFHSDDVTDVVTAQRMLNSCIRKMKIRKIDEGLKLLRFEIGNAVGKDDIKLEKRLIEEYKNLLEQGKLIKGEINEI